jgi:AcrR family transcriptional regulator
VRVTSTRSAITQAGHASSDVLEGSARRWRQGALVGSRRQSRSRAVTAEFQRSRILTAALEAASTGGYAQTSVTAIVARAGISRKTFYELYEDRDGCFQAVFEAAVRQVADVLGHLYVEGQGSWSERVRAALGALLALLERDRELGAFVLEYVDGGETGAADSRAWLLERLQCIAEEGRLQARRCSAPPLAAEVVVGGVLAILHTRLQQGSRQLMALVNPLMWMIVLPYLGPAAAERELRQVAPKPAVYRAKSARGPLERLGMRVTYRTVMVLAAIAEGPGRSNVEVGAEVEIVDAGQISKLLGRLEGLGLIENFGVGQARGAANAWRLTDKGEEVDAMIRHRFIVGGSSRRVNAG